MINRMRGITRTSIIICDVVIGNFSCGSNLRVNKLQGDFENRKAGKSGFDRYSCVIQIYTIFTRANVRFSI